MNLIVTLLLSTALSCPKTQVQLVGDPELGIADVLALKQARARCPVLYPKSPCVKKFMRPSPGTYRVICGAPNSR